MEISPFIAKNAFYDAYYRSMAFFIPETNITAERMAYMCTQICETINVDTAKELATCKFVYAFSGM